MQTQILEQDATHVKFKVDVPAEEVSSAFERVLRELTRQVRVPGFRPGKAPRGVIEARVGKDAVAQEVRDALVQINYPRAVQELSLTPVSQHIHAHEPTEGETYSFEVDVELYPEVTLPELSEIVIDTEKPPLTDELVRETIENLQRQNATLIPVERPAEAGDYLLLEPVDGQGSSLPLDLENVEPNFAAQFYGKAIGDEVEVKLGDPEAVVDDATDGAEAGEGLEGDADTDVAVAVAGDAALSDTGLDDTGSSEESSVTAAVTGTEGTIENMVENTAEATAEMPTPTMRVVVKDIKAKERPERDDDFAQTLGFESWGEAEARIRESLEAQLAQEAMSAQQEEFTEKLMLESTLHVPTSLKERRKANLLQNLAQDLEGRGLTMQGYLEKLEQDDKRAEFQAELDEAAESAVKRDLVLEKLLEMRGTQLSEEEFNAALAYTAQQQNTTVPKLRQELGEDGVVNYRFLLTRDKAVRESVRELLGEPLGTQLEGGAGETGEAGEGTGERGGDPVESEV